MVARKQRIPVVFDTNVFIRNYKSRYQRSPNKRLFRVWRVQKRLQLIVSQETISEYLDIFARVLGASRKWIRKYREFFEHDSRCTVVGLGRRYTESRDPDDNVFLATASASRAEYLITNDRDLLDLPEEFRRALPFEILTPHQFLGRFEGES